VYIIHVDWLLGRETDIAPAGHVPAIRPDMHVYEEHLC